MSKLKEEKRKLILKNNRVFEDQHDSLEELSVVAGIKPSEMMRIVLDRGIDSVKKELKKIKKNGTTT